MRAGKLRHLVEIQAKDVSRDPATNRVVGSDWKRISEPVWAEVEPLSARDFIEASSKQSEVTTRITIRYMRGVRAKMRVVHSDGRIFSIVGVLPDKSSGEEYLTLPCGEGVNEG